MVQQHIGGAGRVGARVIADDGVEAEQSLDEIAFEPAVEVIARRFGEQVEKDAGVLEGQAPEPVAEGARLDEFAEASGSEPVRQVGRRRQHEIAQHVGDCLDLAAEGVVALRVAGAELGELAAGSGLRPPGGSLRRGSAGN